MVQLTQIFDKTSIRVCVQSQPKSANPLTRYLAYMISEKLITSYCYFKTFIKQNFVLSTSPFPALKPLQADVAP